MIPDDFKKLLPKTGAEPETGIPIYFLWVFDPQEDKVILEHNESRHRANHIDHGDLAEQVPHPDRVHGYAYKIRGGWRITDWDHRPVDDTHVVELVRRALRKQPRKANIVGSLYQSRSL